MATISKSDLAVFDGLSIVKLDGFEPEKNLVELEGGMVIDDSPPDPLGTANWLVEDYGIQFNDFDAQELGILWCDFDGPDWQFSVLLASDEVEEFTKRYAEAGYEVRGVEPITEPTTYGDSHAGTVTILKHPDGWCVVR